MIHYSIVRFMFIVLCFIPSLTQAASNQFFEVERINELIEKTKKLKLESWPFLPRLSTTALSQEGLTGLIDDLNNLERRYFRKEIDAKTLDSELEHVEFELNFYRKHLTAQQVQAALRSKKASSVVKDKITEKENGVELSPALTEAKKRKFIVFLNSIPFEEFKEKVITRYYITAWIYEYLKVLDNKVYNADDNMPEWFENSFEEYMQFFHKSIYDLMVKRASYEIINNKMPWYQATSIRRSDIDIPLPRADYYREHATMIGDVFTNVLVAHPNILSLSLQFQERAEYILSSKLELVNQDLEVGQESMFHPAENRIDGTICGPISTMLSYNNNQITVYKRDPKSQKYQYQYNINIAGINSQFVVIGFFSKDETHCFIILEDKRVLIINLLTKTVTIDSTIVSSLIPSIDTKIVSASYSDNILLLVANKVEAYSGRVLSSVYVITTQLEDSTKWSSYFFTVPERIYSAAISHDLTKLVLLLNKGIEFFDIRGGERVKFVARQSFDVSPTLAINFGTYRLAWTPNDRFVIFSHYLPNRKAIILDASRAAIIQEIPDCHLFSISQDSSCVVFKNYAGLTAAGRLQRQAQIWMLPKEQAQIHDAINLEQKFLAQPLGMINFEQEFLDFHFTQTMPNQLVFFVHGAMNNPAYKGIAGLERGKLTTINMDELIDKRFWWQKYFNIDLDVYKIFMLGQLIFERSDNDLLLNQFKKRYKIEDQAPIIQRALTALAGEAHT